MTIWRSHIKIVGSPGGSRIDLCLNKSVLAMGWSLSDRHLEGNNINETDKQKIQKQRSGIKSYDDYAALIKEWNVYGGSVDDNVRRLYYNVKPDDLVLATVHRLYMNFMLTCKKQWVV